jgi:hypothetical protein
MYKLDRYLYKNRNIHSSSWLLNWKVLSYIVVVDFVTKRMNEQDVNQILEITYTEITNKRQKLNLLQDILLLSSSRKLASDYT